MAGSQHSTSAPFTTKTRRAILTGIPAAAIGVGVVASASASDFRDPLIALGAQFETAWRDQVATFDRLSDDMSDAAGEACDAAFDTTMALAAKIETARATSLEGLIVKARAASWCNQGDSFDAVIGPGDNDAEWNDLVKNHGRMKQLAALNKPAYADKDTVNLMEFYESEVKRRAA